jgi:surface antigen
MSRDACVDQSGNAREVVAMKRLTVVCLALALVACATDPGARDTRQHAGATVAGVVVGGLVGSVFGGGTGKVLMTAAGAVAGGFIGDRLYKRHADSEYEKDAAQRALNDAPSGQTVTWSDPRTHESGYFKPVKTHRSSDGRLCRDFERGLTVGGEEVDRTIGTACKQPDGQWDTV